MSAKYPYDCPGGHVVNYTAKREETGQCRSRECDRRIPEPEREKIRRWQEERKIIQVERRLDRDFG
jgi:hypothetical protein